MANNPLRDDVRKVVSIPLSAEEITQGLKDAPTALSTATTALGTADDAKSRANEAYTISLSAETTAQEAKTAAATATETANLALFSARGAESAASAARGVADDAKTIANEAKEQSVEAEATAKSAVSTATSAADTANTARADSASALTNSTTAISTANTAKETAETAISTANTAKADSTTALTKATSVETKANNGEFNGEDGDGIKSITAGASYEEGDYTITPIIFETTSETESEIKVKAKKGAQGPAGGVSSVNGLTGDITNVVFADVSPVVIGDGAHAEDDNSVALIGTAVGGGAVAIVGAADGTPVDGAAVGGGAVAIGGDATGPLTTALGFGAEAMSEGAIAIGSCTVGAAGKNAVAIGRDAYAENNDAIAIGHLSQATKASAIAIGGKIVETSGSIGIGPGGVQGGSAIAIGYGADASSNALNGIAIGTDSQTNKKNSIAFGPNTSTSGEASVAIGYYASAASTEPNTIVLGGYLNSAVHYTGELTKVSDARDKIDIEYVNSSLEFLKKLNPITYVMNYRDEYISDENKQSETYKTYGMCDYDKEAHKRGDKKGTRRRVGLLAQEVYEALKDTYGTDNYAAVVNDNFYDLEEKPTDVENKLTLAYSNLVPFLIGAIKEQQEQIDYLKQEIEYLKKQS